MSMSIWARMSSAIQILSGNDPCAEISEKRDQWESKHRECEQTHAELNSSHMIREKDQAEL